MGYASGVTLDTADGNSILSKTESDASYISKTIASDIAMNGYKITGLGNPSSAQDGATKAYVDSQVGGITSGITQTQADARYLQLSGGSLTGNLAMGSNKITGIINGVNSNDVMTKGYIDGADAFL